jgi:mannose-6-phosphate isomerase
MYPLKMKPVFKDYLWGGSRLKEEYGKDTPYEITGESWEIASHKNGESTVDGGKYNKMTIKELTCELKEKLLGDKVYKGDDEKFPLLIKFIDARDNLSVQVHPDDDFAFKNENGEYGKTEMWYIMDAAEGAGIIYGFKDKITKEEFKKSIEDNTLLEHTHFVECKKGDSFFISAGTLHAIGKGLLIAEIQQNSDTTYRVYDYDRRDANGNPRPLHIEKAIEVTTLDRAQNKTYDDPSVIAECEYFKVEKMDINETVSWTVNKDRFEVIVVCDGNITLNGLDYVKGDTILLPAYIGEVEISGNAQILKTYVM